MSKPVPSAQQQAVLDFVTGGKGSLELVARAGCGKTFTLMLAVEAIRERGLGDIAILAYNAAIAKELKERLDRLAIDWKVARAGTVHSFGFGVWRKVVGPAAERDDFIDDKKVYKIIEAFEDKDAHRCVYRDCAAAIAKTVSLAKQNAFGYLPAVPIDSRDAWFALMEHFGIEDDIADYEPIDILRAAVRTYKRSLALCRETIDFDDMILAPLYFKAKFWPKDWIMVDEAQDTNPARRALALAMLKPRTGRMLFVGDDRQAIYGFTGADSDAMGLLRRATSAATLPLNVTRRCPKLVVALAQSIVPDIVAHDAAPAGTVRTVTYDDLLDTETLQPTDAILCRNTAPLVSTAYAFLSKGVACKVEGREIGKGLIKLARRWKVVRLDALRNRLADYEERETAKLMAQDKEDRIAALTDQLDCLRVIMDRCTLAKQHTVDELCAEIDRMFGEAGDATVATLATIHKSKGREWPRVFVLGRRKFLPSPYAKKEWQQAQEANLEYVALTRSMGEYVDVEM